MPGNYFQGFDFAQGSTPLAPAAGPIIDTGDAGPPPIPPPPTPGLGLPDISSLDPLDMAKEIKKVLDQYRQSPDYDEYAPAYSNLVKAYTDLMDAASKEHLQGVKDEALWQRQIELAKMNAERALDAARISAGATLGASAEATRRQGLQQEFTAAEAEKTRGFTAGQAETARTFTAGESQKGRQFESEQNALDREIRRVQNEIAQGTLNLQSALGQLQRWLEAQQYTLPEGAEYVPGFQPGGAVQEGARLAGVGYNPANFKANTVPFDPGAMVRQTMGR